MIIDIIVIFKLYILNFNICIQLITGAVPDLDGGKVGKCPGLHISRGPYI